MVLTAKIGTLLEVLFRKPMAESVDLGNRMQMTWYLFYTLVREACVLAGRGYNRVSWLVKFVRMWLEVFNHKYPWSLKKHPRRGVKNAKTKDAEKVHEMLSSWLTWLLPSQAHSICDHLHRSTQEQVSQHSIMDGGVIHESLILSRGLLEAGGY